jgi:acyl-CoA thioesterase-1
MQFYFSTCSNCWRLAAVFALSVAFASAAFAFPATAFADSAAARSSASEAVVVMGDSISAGYGIQREQGWVELLAQDLYQGEYDWRVINASVSGETTGGGLSRLPGVLAEHAPAIVIIELGGNDGLRGYPVARIRDNLTQMADMVSAAGAVPLIVSMRIPPNYGPRYTRAFDAVFGEVAEQSGAVLVPFLLDEVALDPELMQNDGIHPTALAQPLLLDAVWPYLEPLL